ncbi:MAG: NAD(P)/FAD-dependent oxidoreductase [Deltaproteobacteria bacterium]|nr:NAD(P)/FAD-dependent oxidoreductase [Deltaproteobacteria bacterium]
MVDHEVIIIGAGAAGMMCALHAGRRGRRVLLVDHSDKPGKKILLSGGGRCNFTNTGASPAQYVSCNPHFCKSALSRYPASDFIRMVFEHGIAFHEKKLGQLFCSRSAQDIVNLLMGECCKAGVQFRLQCKVSSIARLPGAELGSARFSVATSQGDFQCESLVIATGGLSLPKSGASGFGYEVARQFGLNIISTSAALDGFVIGDYSDLAGVSVDCLVSCHKISFRENILFTHAGLSGPAALQTSLYWNHGDEIQINLLPEMNCFQWLLNQKQAGSRATVKNLLHELLPARLVDKLCALHFSSSLSLPQVSEKALEKFCHLLQNWCLTPSGTVGYSKAEVTRGGVDSAELSSITMEAIKVQGLYFIGEVLDVTGWLGGYNFQWAWASGWAAAQVV